MSDEYALEVNLQIRKELSDLKEKLNDILSSIRRIYITNELLLRNFTKTGDKGIGIRGAYLKGGTFYLIGNMFFKDLNCRNCPNNSDYVLRSNRENEMFPMDLELLGRHVWSLKDKQIVVEAIKEQVSDHLNNSNKIKVAVNQKQFLLNERLSKLLSLVNDNFTIDWEQIARNDLRYRHSQNSCEAIWNVYLNPNLRRCSWTDSENLILLESAKKLKFQDWRAVAEYLQARSDFQCFVQYQNSACYKLPQRWNKWSKKDDETLIKIVTRNTFNGVINWNNVMTYFPYKPKTTIQARYAYTLNPHISHAKEDLLLLASVREYGTKFSCFPKTLFPNRTVVQLRNRYKNTILHRHKYQPWTLDDDKKLLKFVSEHGSSSWLNCAKILGNHSRTSCRTRFLTINRYFDRYPEATVENITRKTRNNPPNSITSENWTSKLVELKEYKPNRSLLEPKLLQQRVRRNTEKKIENHQLIYIERLPPIRLKLYNYFKYSYNYETGFDIRCKTTTCDLLIINQLAKTFNFKIPTELCKFDTIFPSFDHGKPNAAIDNPFSRVVPMNWSTCIGFRAVCVLRQQTNLKEIPDFSKALSQNSNIVQFRSRLHHLFYLTAVLSCIHPNSLHPKCKINARYQNNDGYQSISEKENELCTQSFTRKRKKNQIKTTSQTISYIESNLHPTNT